MAYLTRRLALKVLAVGLVLGQLPARVWARMLAMGETAYRDGRPSGARFVSRAQSLLWSGYSFIRYDFLGKYTKNLAKTAGDLEAELRLVVDRLTAPLRRGRDKNAPVTCDPEKSRMAMVGSLPVYHENKKSDDNFYKSG